VVKAARAIRAMGPKVLVIKKGEHGVLMFTEHGSFGAPAYPLEQVFDPTGAGDAFAGGFVGYLASVQESEGDGDFDDDSLRRAVVMGSTLASFSVEAFSLQRLLKLSRTEIDERYRLFKRLTHFELI
jgi:sugar/nucleoside kinase (ribokinase family)